MGHKRIWRRKTKLKQLKCKEMFPGLNRTYETGTCRKYDNSGQHLKDKGTAFGSKAKTGNLYKYSMLKLVM